MSSDELQGEKFEFLNVKILSLDQIYIFCSCTMKTTCGASVCEHLAFRGLIIIYLLPSLFTALSYLQPCCLSKSC